MKFIPVASAKYGLLELFNIAKVALSFRWSEGKYAKLFTNRFSAYLGVKFATLTNSGSSANLLAVASLTSKSLGKRALKRGDHFITTPFCFPTTINPALIYGLKPDFVDIDWKTLNIDVDKIEQAITPKTKLIMFAHTLGIPANMDRVMEIARKYNLWVIEDCCDALGATWNGKKVGTYGDMATFSFYPAHHLSMGEGGAIVTNNPFLYKNIRSFCNWGRHCWCTPGHDNTCRNRFGWQLGKLPKGYDHKYIYSEIGYNLKPTDFQAAIGLAQLDRLKGFIEKRNYNYQWLSETLKCPPYKTDSPFGFMFTVNDRASLIAHLEKHGVATRMIFSGNITKHPGYLHLKANVPNCEFVMEHGLWIGCHPQITIEDLLYIKSVFDSYDRDSRGIVG